MLSQTPMVLIERGDSEAVLAAAREFAQASAGGAHDRAAVRRRHRRGAPADAAGSRTARRVIAGIATTLLKRLGTPERVCYVGQTRLPGHGDRRIVDRLLAGEEDAVAAELADGRSTPASSSAPASWSSPAGRAQQVRPHRHDVVAGREARAQVVLELGEALRRASGRPRARARAAPRRSGSGASRRTRSSGRGRSRPARRSRAGRRRAPRSRRRPGAAARRSRPPGAARRSTRTRGRRFAAPGRRCAGPGRGAGCASASRRRPTVGQRELLRAAEHVAVVGVLRAGARDRVLGDLDADRVGPAPARARTNAPSPQPMSTTILPRRSTAFAELRRSRSSLERRLARREEAAGRCARPGDRAVRRGAVGDAAARRPRRRGDQDRGPGERRRRRALRPAVSARARTRCTSRRSTAASAACRSTCARRRGGRCSRTSCASSDAVYSNLRGDQPAKLRITYERPAALNPRIVCCSLSGFGMTGPRRAEPALRLRAAGAGGLDEPDRRAGRAAGEVGALARRLLGRVRRPRSRCWPACGARAATASAATATRRCSRRRSSLLTYVGTWAATRGPRRRAPRGVRAPVDRARSRPSRPRTGGSRSRPPSRSSGWGCARRSAPELADDARFAGFDERARHREELLADPAPAVRARLTAEVAIARLSAAGVPVRRRSTTCSARSTTRRSRPATRSSSYEHPRLGDGPAVGLAAAARAPIVHGARRRAARTRRRCCASCAATTTRGWTGAGGGSVRR